MQSKLLPLAIFSSLILSACVGEEETDVVEDLTDAYLENQNADSADSSRCSGVIVPDRGPFNRRIALTFDDGPSASNTPIVLAALAKHGVKATFFVTGRAARAEPELLREMHDAGHIIANHTDSHPNSVRISLDSFRSEVSRTHGPIEALGVTNLFFRFPYGSANCDTVGVVEEYGYHVTGWHIDTADWCFANSRGGVGYCDARTFAHVPNSYRDDYVGYTLSQARANGGGILLMHDVHSFTANRVDALLAALLDDGFEFTTLDDVTTFPRLNGEEPPPEPWVGTPCATVDECGFSYGERQAYCATFTDPETFEEHGFCSLSCEGSCPDRYGHATTFCVEAGVPGQGLCVAKAEDENDHCAEIPGTMADERARFVGNSGSAQASALVCVP